eukprot:5789263-Pyramimonas_sp.AAC.1
MFNPEAPAAEVGQPSGQHGPSLLLIQSFPTPVAKQRSQAQDKRPRVGPSPASPAVPVHPTPVGNP